MIFEYTYIDDEGNEKSGVIDTVNKDAAINSLQKKGLTISSIKLQKKSGGSIFNTNIKWLEKVSQRDVVMLSRQIATLFEAQVSALKVFTILSENMDNPKLRRALLQISKDLKAGSSIAAALSKHPDIFSEFYVSMVKSGEESGQLSKTFLYLADYLGRTYKIYSKAKNALIYPAFVLVTFIAVMVLMLTVVIPKISKILEKSGTEMPIYTKIVLGLSNFLVDYGLLLLLLIIAAAIFGWNFIRSKKGKKALERFQLSIPFIGDLYKKLYLSRLADTLATMLSSGVAMLHALEVSKETVGSIVYEEILTETSDSVKAGGTVSGTFSYYSEIPNVMVGMIKVGEESGELSDVLNTLSKFYRKEVTYTVETLVSMIEPILIGLLGIGVGVLMAAVLLPMYNLASGI